MIINGSYISCPKCGWEPDETCTWMCDVMAWLAYYRNEDISWKHYLSRTVRKYFEKSYKFIEENHDGIKWDLEN